MNRRTASTHYSQFGKHFTCYSASSACVVPPLIYLSTLVHDNVMLSRALLRRLKQPMRSVECTQVVWCGAICLSAVCDPIHRLLDHQSEAVLGTTLHIWSGAQFASVHATICIVKSAPRIAPRRKSVPGFTVLHYMSVPTLRKVLYKICFMKTSVVCFMARCILLSRSFVRSLEILRMDIS